MSRRRRFGMAVLGVAAIALLLGGAGPARAEFVITISQMGTDVVATGTGSFNLTALTFSGDTGDVHAMTPSIGTVELGALSSTIQSTYSGFTGPTSIGPGGIAFATGGSGPVASIGGEAGLIGVPVGYTSGTLISDSATWANTTISGLGLTPGHYEWTWGSGPTADDLQVNIPSVPEPSSLALLATGALGLLGYGWRRRKPVA